MKFHPELLTHVDLVVANTKAGGRSIDSTTWGKLFNLKQASREFDEGLRTTGRYSGERQGLRH